MNIGKYVKQTLDPCNAPGSNLTPPRPCGSLNAADILFNNSDLL